MPRGTVRELIAYLFGNALGVMALLMIATGIRGMGETGPAAGLPLLGGALVASWWLRWVLREYVRPAARRAEVGQQVP